MKHPSASSQWKVPLWVPTLLPILSPPPSAANVRQKLPVDTGSSCPALPHRWKSHHDGERATADNAEELRRGAQGIDLLVTWDSMRLRSIVFDLATPSATTRKIKAYRIAATVPTDAWRSAELDSRTASTHHPKAPFYRRYVAVAHRPFSQLWPRRPLHVACDFRLEKRLRFDMFPLKWTLTEKLRRGFVGSLTNIRVSRNGILIWAQ